MGEKETLRLFPSPDSLLSLSTRTHVAVHFVSNKREKEGEREKEKEK